MDASSKLEAVRSVVGSALHFLEQISNNLRMAYWRLRLAKLGAGTRIYPRALIYVPRNVAVGARVSLNDFVHIRGGGGVDIGDDTLIAPGVVITTQSHDIAALEKGLSYNRTNTEESIKIGKNVWIGAGAIILPGVVIGDNSVVAAGTLVRANIPANCLVAGVPGKLVRHLAGRD